MIAKLKENATSGILFRGAGPAHRLFCLLRPVSERHGQKPQHAPVRTAGIRRFACLMAESTFSATRKAMKTGIGMPRSTASDTRRKVIHSVSKG